jgi:predicted RecB family endonuclease
VSKIDPHDPEAVAQAVGIAKQLAAEIEFENDERGERWENVEGKWQRITESPAERWIRMRKWLEKHTTGTSP